MAAPLMATEGPVSQQPPHVPELLAPAGDRDALAAALQAGADAVYFGLDDGLNARARAANFALSDLPATCARIHRAGALAYLTLNTLVFENELPFLETVLRQVAAAGVDAVIVQDPAVALLCRALAPTLHVHASTQMTISSPEASQFAAQLGIVRVVVPRELSLGEIGQMAQKTALELEVFVHGALCVSWSGQCLTSEAWGGRSANRGQCAQSCRMPYDLLVDGQQRDLGDVRYLLSPLDLSGLEKVSDLAQLGVAGLKIEGRQKGPQYVQTAVNAYRRQLDHLSAGPHSPQARVQADQTAMALSYSRGLSLGFLGGPHHQDTVEGRFPKHRGVLLGDVAEVRDAAVRVVRAARPVDQGQAPELRAGMGIGFDLGRPEADEPGGSLFGVEATHDGWWLRLGQGAQAVDLRRVQPGDRVWLTQDPILTRETDKLVAATEPEGRVAVDVTVSGQPGQPLQVTWTARGPVGRDAQVQTQSAMALQPAAGQGLDQVMITSKLLALGGTPWRLGDLQLANLQSGLHLPVSELKRLRRELAAELDSAVNARHVHALQPQPVAEEVRRQAATLHARRPWPKLDAPQLLPLVRTEAQLEAVIDAQLPKVALDWMELVGLTRAVERARAAGLKVVLATPRIQKPGEEGFDRRLARLQPDGVLVRHWGGLMHFATLPQPPHIHGDFSLNVTNSVTAHHLWALGADTLCAAHDLDVAQLQHLLEHVPAERVEVVIHHHMATFHTEHCVYAHLLSQGQDFHSCGRPCEQHAVSLQDHQGRAHPVVVDVGCRNTVFNAQAQSAAGAVAGLLKRGVQHFRTEFVREDRATTLAVLKAYQALLTGELPAKALLAQVGVHEQFGVTSGTMRAMEGRHVAN
jgi:putative protease